MKTPAPAGTALQLSARDEQGRWVLSVLAKRTYQFDAAGKCFVSQAQTPLVEAPVYDEKDKSLLLTDSDVWPIKARTDVVVLGHAYNRPSRPTFMTGVRVGTTTKMVRVHGDRRATLTADDRVLFSPPTVCERIPLSYAFAYGGRDAVTEERYGNPVADLQRYLMPEVTEEKIAEASPFVYPRNPAGRGYVVEKTSAAIENAVLPNLEHPEDPLSPERLVAGDTGRWPLQPIPASLGWLDYGAFPRMAWLGVMPDHDPVANPRAVAEVRLGYATVDVLSDDAPTQEMFLEGVNGASLGLRLPHLRGGEEVELLNVHRSLDLLTFRLPSEKPTLWADGRNGKLAETKPVVHSVVIEPELFRVTLVWRGSAPALRPYGANEIGAMPFVAEW